MNGLSVLRELTINDPIEKDELNDLIKKAQAGDEDAKWKVFQHNGRMMHEIIMKHSIYDDAYEIDDVCQWVFELVLGCIRRYKPENGSFYNFCVNSIPKKLFNITFQHSSLVRIPHDEQSNYLKAKVKMQNGEELTEKEQNMLGFKSVDYVEDYKKEIKTEFDTIFKQIAKKELSDIVQNELSDILDNREQKVIDKSFGLTDDKPLPDRAICELINPLNGSIRKITHQRVHQIKVKAKKRLSQSKRLKELYDLL